MKKAWFILIVSSVVFVVLKYIIPKELATINKSEEFEQLLNEQIKDTLNSNEIELTEKFNDSIKNIAIQKQKTDSINKLIAYKNINRKGLTLFFKELQKLEKTKKNQVRIAFFGDSMEDGDMIIMQLRHFMQQKFGGKGVGFVPITSVTAKGRYSIKHSFSNNWNTVNFMNKGYGKFHFGLNGQTFYVGDSIKKDKATVSFKQGNAYKELPLINPILFYGNSIKDSTNSVFAKMVYTSEEKSDSIVLSSKNVLNTHSLFNYTKNFTISIQDQQTTPFYGVSFASKNGIIIDNLSVRGNSGLPLTKLNSRLMQHFDKYFHYDLIVLAYGTNAFSFTNKKYKWYQKRMLRVVNHMKKCFPNADILIVSMGDRSTKIDGVMQTPAHLPDFINLQYTIAEKSNSGFFNLYKAMGGFNSMVQWVEIDSLANKDYTHFNAKGAKKAGKLMYNWLMENYKNSCKKKIKKDLSVGR